MTIHAMTVVLVGLAAGYLADLIMKRRGYGVTGDILLGVCGSFAAGALFNLLATAPGREWLPMIVASFVGGVVLIVGQRLFWQADLWEEPPSAGPRSNR